MLVIAPPAPKFGVPSRRAVKAAALLLRLAGISPKALVRHFQPEPTRFIALDQAGLAILPTTCGSPLFLEEAKALAIANEVALIVRFATDLRPREGLVSVDVVTCRTGRLEANLGLRPCLSQGLFPLSFARSGAAAPDFFLTSRGLRTAGYRAPNRWDAGVGIAAADAFFKAHMWGGF
jgi:hypothetical protein